MYYIIILTIIAADQAIKSIIRTEMLQNQTIPVLENIFHLTYIQNHGAAFSILQNQRFALVLVTSFLIAGLIFYLVKIRQTASPWLLWSFALIIGGGIGNMIDRLARGFVVDYLDFRVFPIFNFADMTVCIGCGVLVLYILILEPRMEKRRNLE